MSMTSDIGRPTGGALATYRVLLACWMWLAYSGWVIEEILPFLEPVRMPVGVLVDAAIAVTGMMCIRRWGELIGILGLCLLSYFSSIFINEIPMPLYANGMRDLFALMFLPPLLRRVMADDCRSWVMPRFDRQLYIWLCIQAFCLVEECVRYGAGDHGGGSMGNGYSGIVSTAIYIVSFYLMSKRWQPSLSYAANIRGNMALVLLLLPTFLNETKVSFVFFAVYFILLFRLDRTFLPKLGIIIPVLAAFLFLGYTVYSSTSGNEDVFTNEYMEEYLAGDSDVDIEDAADAFQEGLFDDEEWDVDVPRAAKILFLPPMLDTAKGGMVLGAGMGHFKGWDSGNTTQLYKDNQWIMYGTFPYIFAMVLQLGILGLAWVLGFFVYSTRPRRNPGYHSLNIKIFIYIMVGVILFYNDSLRDMFLMIVLFYIAIATSYAAPFGKRDSAGVQDTAVAV